MGIYKEKPQVVETEFSMQRRLITRYQNQAKYMVHNICYNLGEMDMFLLRRTGYAEEFEIKVTTSDLRADSKKIRKFNRLTNIFESGIGRFQKLCLPNKFSYVLGPEVEWQGIELPEYAGIYTVSWSGLNCVRNPKFIHKVKQNWDGKVAASCSHRLMRMYFDRRNKCII